MAAKDYVFQSGWRDVYLAKQTKSKKLISQDRRVVTDNEIIGLFEHYLKKWSEEHKGEVLVISDGNGKPIFEATLYTEETARRVTVC